MTWLALELAQDSLRPAYEASLAAIEEGAKAPEAASAFMASLGGPTTLAEFQAALAGFIAATDAWRVYLSAYLATLPQSCLVGMVYRPLGTTGTWHIERPGYIPNEHAAVLRAAPELAALIAAFEAVGA
ncbi:hypothetical protein SAMN05877831_1183 [Rhodobacter maris]|uniref:Uncharacterized protein n=2 Tax=Rhodobacter maris TaxID=446682 RepID=A0A285TC24_9RHOB|nr:hypothetical protein SAMN05877831_1183 [Rhodobacter maris]